MNRIYFLIVFVAFTFNCCDEQNCQSIDGVNITNLLYLAAKNNSYPYCDFVEKSVKGDKEALRKLCLLKIDEAAGYDHGALLLDVMTKIGSLAFIDALSNISETEKQFIKTYLDVGLEYGGKYSESSRLEQVFPKVAIFLEE